MSQSSGPTLPFPSLLRPRLVRGLLKLGEITLLTRDTLRQAFKRPFEWSALL